MKKKITFITSGIGTGGAERQLALLAGGLRDRGFKPTIISLSAAPNPLPEFENLETYVCPLEKGLGSPRRFLKLWRKIRQLEPDIIQGWMYAGNLLASILAIGLKPPRVFHSVRASNMDSTRYGRQIRLNGLASHFSRATIFNSEAGMDFHKNMGFSASNFQLIPNGIDTDKFSPEPRLRDVLRRNLGFASGDKVVLYVARLDPMKGHKTVLDVALACPEYKFVIAGKDTETLEASSNVTCLGAWENIAELYNAADLLVSISNFGEGFPNVIGEAMACGLHVLANDVGDSRAIIGNTGYICASPDAEIVSKQIRSIFDRRNNVVKPADPRQRILTSFSCNAMVEAYASLYQKEMLDHVSK